MPKVGYRFRPTEQELVNYFLYNKITQNPVLDDHDGVKMCDLYGDQEPWGIWNVYGGNDLLKDEALYFFTQLKKLTPNGSRYNRRIASGVWQGEDGAKAVMAYGGSKQIIGFKKRFRYEDGNNSEQNGRWIMYEYTINSSFLGEQYSHKATDYVVCSMKKNEKGQQKEETDLGKKKSKSKQIGKKNGSGEGATGRKRKLKQTATSNNNDHHGDQGVQNKRLKPEQEAPRIEQNQLVELPCANSVLQVLHSEETDSNFEFSGRPIGDLLDFITFDVEDLVSNSNESGDIDTQFYIHEGDECSALNGEQKGEEEALHANESEAETEPLLDFDELFVDIDREFAQVFGSNKLELFEH